MCFGVYSSVLWLCAAEGVKKIDLAKALVQSVDSKCLMTSQAVTALFNCTKGLPNGKGENSLGDVVNSARNADAEKTIAFFLSEIVPLIAPSNRVKIFFVIRDIISKDASIHDDAIVDMISGATKKDVLNMDEFSLADFLAGVFLYVVTVDNRDGADCVDAITTDYINSVSIPVKPTEGTNVLPINTGTLKTYLLNAAEKFKNIKTLLYANEPKLFYGFYVPNNVGVPSAGKYVNAIENVTATKLMSQSNFIILDGNGGVGKTMMMRHLLLDAIENFDTLQLTPVFIPLKSYTGEPMLDFICKFIHFLSKGYTKEATENALTEGSVLLLMDGMDEIKEAHFAAFEIEIERITDKFPNAKYVISSRSFQPFVSLNRFTVLKLMPFTPQQSIDLINKLDFRPNEPEFKKSFIREIQGGLSSCHRSFIENPLLLTIMLMTYDKFARLPEKHHEFYQRAFFTLAETHDATKSDFTRIHKTGFDTTAFNNAFAEFCFITFVDNKIEFTEDDLMRYMDSLQTMKKYPADARSLAFDFCSNLCLLYKEGNRYHFTHRTFQEYFCALFFSRQNPTFLAHLVRFFETRKSSTSKILAMLYDMIPERVEEIMFAPYLQEMYDDFDNKDGYWTFLERIYPSIRYMHGTIDPPPVNSPSSFLFGFIVKLINPQWTLHGESLPSENSSVMEEHAYIQTGEETREQVNIEKLHEEHPWYQGDVEVSSGIYEINIAEIRVHCELYKDHSTILNNDEFVYKSEYLAVRQYLIDITARQKENDEFLLSLLKQ